MMTGSVATVHQMHGRGVKNKLKMISLSLTALIYSRMAQIWKN